MSLTDNVIMPGKDYQNACDVIREKTGKNEPIKSGDLVTEINMVYEAGEKAEYDAFWDIYQNKGNRGGYPLAFASTGWNDKTYNPKYPIIATNTSQTQMFYNSEVTDTKVDIDISKVTASIYGLFYASKLKVIKSLIVSEKNVWNACFNSCNHLRHIKIQGIIGQNGFDVHWSTLLDKESIILIINALSDTTSDLIVTLSMVAVNNAFETSEKASNGTESEEWLTLIATKPNWTISLV